MNTVRLDRHSSMVEVVKPAVDKLRYRCVVLDNNIRITLVSDPEADKAAAAMDVGFHSQHVSMSSTILLHQHDGISFCRASCVTKSFHTFTIAHPNLIVA